MDKDLLSPTTALTTEDPRISDSSSDKSLQLHCEVPLGDDGGVENTVDTDSDCQVVDPIDDDNAIVLDSDVSVQLKIENEDQNCDNEFEFATTDASVVSNSDATTTELTGAPLKKVTIEVSDEIEANEEEWPKAFYCQRTHILMTNPMVGPDGISIDRSAVDQGDPKPYYPNRALQAILQETMTLRKHPFRASLKQLQQSVSHGLSQLLPDWRSHESLVRPLNDAFYCPITYNLMHKPVIDPEGNTFERVAVENWIRINQSSPITRTDLRIEQLYPNTALEKLLQEEKERPDDQMHPAIRKWKEEPVPTATDVELGGRAVREQELRRQRQDGSNPTVIVISRPHGASPLVYPITYQQLSLRRENTLRARYRFIGYLLAGCFLTVFVFNEHLVFLSLFLLTLLFVCLKRPLYYTV